MDAGNYISNIAAYISDPSRAAMLWSLIGGESRPASELAMLANVSAQTASRHLKQLVEGGLLTVRKAGRNKFYCLSGPSVATALESLAAVGRPDRGTAGLAQQTRPELVFARTCYDHLAGELAVGILKRLLDSGFLRGTKKEYRLTEVGAAFFRTLGVDIPAVERQRRRFAYPCLDWSHRVPHLGGALGAALLDWLLKSRIVVRSTQARSVRVTDRGEETLVQTLSIRLTRQRTRIVV